MREICEVIASGIQPLQNLIVLIYVGEERKNEWAQHWITRGFRAVEKLLSASAGTYTAPFLLKKKKHISVQGNTAWVTRSRWRTAASSPRCSQLEDSTWTCGRFRSSCVSTGSWRTTPRSGRRTPATSPTAPRRPQNNRSFFFFFEGTLQLFIFCAKENYGCCLGRSCKVITVT